MKDDIRWILRDWEWVPYAGYLIRTNIDPKSPEGILKLVKYHADGAYEYWKEPGPAWYRRITRQVPLRRSSARILRRVLQGEDLEVIIETKPPLEYWS